MGKTANLFVHRYAQLISITMMHGTLWPAVVVAVTEALIEHKLDPKQIQSLFNNQFNKRFGWTNLPSLRWTQYIKSLQKTHKRTSEVAKHGRKRI